MGKFKPELSQEDFIARYCQNTDGVESREEFEKRFVALPCRCGEQGCLGWSAHIRDPLLILSHYDLRYPASFRTKARKQILQLVMETLSRQQERWTKDWEKFAPKGELVDLIKRVDPKTENVTPRRMVGKRQYISLYPENPNPIRADAPADSITGFMLRLWTDLIVAVLTDPISVEQCLRETYTVLWSGALDDLSEAFDYKDKLVAEFEYDVLGDFHIQKELARTDVGQLLEKRAVMIMNAAVERGKAQAKGQDGQTFE